MKILNWTLALTALAAGFYGCSTTNSETVSYGVCNGQSYDADEKSCFSGTLVDVCNDSSLYSIMHVKGIAIVCRKDSSWTEASKNETYFDRGCDSGNENAVLEYGYSTVVCIQDTSHAWKWVVENQVELSRLKSSSSSDLGDEPVSSGESENSSSSSQQEDPKSSSSLQWESVEYDGYTYKTVGIGTQMWMAENLRVTAGIDSSWCYNDEPENCEIYGRLYTWATAMNIDEKYQTQSALKDGVISETSHNQGICPSGWHIPSDDEWQTLFDFVDASNGIATAGQSLCDPNGAWKGYDNYPMTDDYGFSAIPGGKYHYVIEGNNNVGWKDLGASMHVWSATESVDSAATNVYTRYIQPKEIDRNDFPKARRRYVRCVMD